MLIKYPIQRWDSITFSNIIKYPLIYFIPDYRLLNFIKNFNENIYIMISNTNSVYDNKIFYTKVENSAFIPNCRLNFSLLTNYNICILTVENKNINTWMGYPCNLGIVTFLGITLPLIPYTIISSKEKNNDS